MKNQAARRAAEALLVGTMAVLAGCPTSSSGNGSSGDPPPKAAVGEACTDNGGCQSDICVSGTCRACAPGSSACECLANDTCNTGLVCRNETCQACTEGSQGCPCRSDTTCDGTLECSNGVCVPDNCPAGTQGCACTSTGTCGNGLACVNMMCAACSDDTAGCPCSNGACTNGLVCNTATNACRAPRTCMDAACVQHQVCMPGSAGMDARCLEQCDTGYTFNTTTGMCDAVATANCDAADAGTTGSILATCDGQNRVCETTQSGAQCGACKPSFVDDTANPTNCRAVRTCADVQATCDADNRDCTAATATTDAVCGACKAGYVDMAGTCVVETVAVCDADGGPGSLNATCEGRGRLCESGDGGPASCGACLPGFEQDPLDTMRCIQPRTCADIMPSCNSLGRECAGSPRAECGACFQGLVPENASDPLSRCRLPRTCNDPDFPGCGMTEYCVDGPGMEATCMAWPCTSTLGMPDTTKALRVDTNACVTCPITCNDTGATGRFWPFTRSGTDTCLCETEPGFYYDTSGAFTTGRCDADGDGWVREAARALINSADPGTRANARCSLRRVERITLRNEWKEELDILLCGEGPVRVVDSSTACTMSGGVYLYESTRNDDQFQINQNSDLVPSYTNGTEGRKLRAAEVNAFTKACVSTLADYNDDKKADLTQDQGQARDGSLPAEYGTFMQFAYFTELHKGFYELMPDGKGRYVIEEKSRCDADFPIGYLDTTNDYWKQCSRYRDKAFMQNALQGQDFAQWTCTGSACLPPPPLPADSIPPTGGVIPPHGLCEVAKPLAAGVAGWRGMSHQSQFRCVAINGGDPAGVTYRQAGDVAVDASDRNNEVFNRCTVDCPDGDTGCVSDCTGSGACTSSSVSQGMERNPAIPRITCAPTPRSAVQLSQVGFVAQNYEAGNDTRGCLDEWDAWPNVCPGYNAVVPVAVGEGNVADFGALICGCSVNYGGPDCDIGCPSSDLFYDSSYNANTRQGYWMCGSPSRVGPGTLSGTSGTTTYTLRGDIPLSGASGVLCQNADCATGYVLR